jgi:hypothetical protein
MDETVVEEPDWDDPIYDDPVVEVRKIREYMAKKYGYENDIDRFFDFLYELDAKSTGTFVDWPVLEPNPMLYPEVQGGPVMVVAEERAGYEAK